VVAGEARLTHSSNLIHELLEFVDDAIDDLGSREEIGHIYTILERGTSADEQLQVWRDTGNIKAVVDRLIETTMENVPCEVIPGALTAVP
jgi:carboxylate-amine ligase